MKNYERQEKKNKSYDPIDSYFECITSCDIADGTCISQCVQLLKDDQR